MVCFGQNALKVKKKCFLIIFCGAFMDSVFEGFV